MAHAPEKRNLVRAGYVYQRLDLPAAADAAGVPLATARRWRYASADLGDDWDKARAARHVAGEGLAQLVQSVVEDYLAQHQAAIESLRQADGISPLARAEALSRLADAFTKTMAAAGKASPSMSRLAVAMEVLEALATLVRRDYPQHGTALAELVEPLSVDLAKRFG